MHNRMFDENSADSIAFFKEFISNMKKAGGTGTIRIDFSGSNDSGDVSYFALTDEQVTCAEQVIAANIGKTDLSTKDYDEYMQGLIDMVYDLLPAGWEINEGSDGSLVLDIDKQKVYLDRNEY